MSGDLISRYAMIDAMRRRKEVFCKNRIEFMVLPKDEQARVDEIDNCISDLVNAPDAEPERIIKIGRRSGKTLESAINYLQSTGWLQEHDRILTESAEPKRKKGAWIYDTESVLYNGGIYAQYHCSECGFRELLGRLENFCPNCGAEMTGRA